MIDDISEELLASWSQRRHGGPGPRTFVRGDDGMYRVGTQDPATLPPQFNRMTAMGAAPIGPDMPIAEPAPAPATPSIGNQLLGGLADDMLNMTQGLPAGVLEGAHLAPDDIRELLSDDSVPMADRLRMAQAMADKQGIELAIRRAPAGGFDAVVLDPETAATLPQGVARGLQGIGSLLNIGQIDPVAGTGAAIARAAQGVKGADTVMGMGAGPVGRLKPQDNAVLRSVEGADADLFQRTREIRSQYPEGDFAPFTITGAKKKPNGEWEVKVAKQAYDFQTPPGNMTAATWRTRMTDRIVGEVDELLNRVQSGDPAARAILDEANWYRAMRTKLREEFGGFGDIMADVLGTTSAQTPVRMNFDNTIEVMRRFARGEYDAEINAYERRLNEGGRMDPKTLILENKAGEFPLIAKASGALFGTNSPAATEALLNMFRRIEAGDAPKTPNFTGNLIGLTNEATIDVWAARFLRRLAGDKPIAPAAEQAVTGKHRVGSTLEQPSVGGEFGFGQDVMRDAAARINSQGRVKQIDPAIGDLGPDDLQAVAWFIEKERWTNNGWTNRAGEGGSLDYEMRLAGAADQERVRELRGELGKGFSAPAQRKNEDPQAYEARVTEARRVYDENAAASRSELDAMGRPVDRYTAGFSIEREGQQPKSNYAFAEAAAEFDDVIRNDKTVVTYQMNLTHGRFAGANERALNTEVIVRNNFDPAPLTRRLIEQAKATDQDATFISRVLRSSGDSDNARPGVEIYWKHRKGSDFASKVADALTKYGVDGFTFVTDARAGDRVNVMARAGGGDTAGLTGIRFQYVPEFDSNFNPARRAEIMREKAALYQDIVDDIIAGKVAQDAGISSANRVWYDTQVFKNPRAAWINGGEEYDVYLGRGASRPDQAAGAKRSVDPVSAGADRRAEIGQDVRANVRDGQRGPAGQRNANQVKGARQPGRRPTGGDQ